MPTLNIIDEEFIDYSRIKFYKLFMTINEFFDSESRFCHTATVTLRIIDKINQKKFLDKHNLKVMLFSFKKSLAIIQENNFSTAEQQFKECEEMILYSTSEKNIENYLKYLNQTCTNEQEKKEVWNIIYKQIANILNVLMDEKFRIKKMTELLACTNEFEKISEKYSAIQSDLKTNQVVTQVLREDVIQYPDSLENRKGKDLLDYLVEPFQRVLRYSLLFNQFKECIDNQPYADIDRLIKKIRNVADLFNHYQMREHIITVDLNYQLCIWEEGQIPQDGKLYLKTIDKEYLRYIVKSPSGSIADDQIQISLFSQSFQDQLHTDEIMDINKLNPYLTEILLITKRRGHTNSIDQESALYVSTKMYNFITTSQDIGASLMSSIQQPPHSTKPDAVQLKSQGSQLHIVITDFMQGLKDLEDETRFLSSRNLKIAKLHETVATSKQDNDEAKRKIKELEEVNNNLTREFQKLRTLKNKEQVVTESRSSSTEDWIKLTSDIFERLSRIRYLSTENQNELGQLIKISCQEKNISCFRMAIKKLDRISKIEETLFQCQQQFKKLTQSYIMYTQENQSIFLGHGNAGIQRAINELISPTGFFEQVETKINHNLFNTFLTSCLQNENTFKIEALDALFIKITKEFNQLLVKKILILGGNTDIYSYKTYLLALYLAIEELITNLEKNIEIGVSDVSRKADSYLVQLQDTSSPVYNRDSPTEIVKRLSTLVKYKDARNSSTKEQIADFHQSSMRHAPR